MYNIIIVVYLNFVLLCHKSNLKFGLIFTIRKRAWLLFYFRSFHFGLCVHSPWSRAHVYNCYIYVDPFLCCPSDVSTRARVIDTFYFDIIFAPSIASRSSLNGRRGQAPRAYLKLFLFLCFNCVRVWNPFSIYRFSPNNRFYVFRYLQVARVGILFLNSSHSSPLPSKKKKAVICLGLF